MGQSIRLLAITGIGAILMAGCSGLPTDPGKPVPAPLPIPSPSTTASTFATKVDTMTSNVITTWKTQAAVSGVVINSNKGDLSAGNVKGPNLGGFFTQELGKISATDSERRIIQAFNTAFSDGFAKWQSTYTATLTFPGFDAVQASLAPATANQAQSVSAGSADETGLTASALSTTVRNALGTVTDNEGLAIDTAAAKMAARFTAFKTGTQLKNVVGSGAVPAYNPPFAPSGPVVNGSAAGATGAVFK